MHLLTALLLFLTGAGLARYLGARLNWGYFMILLIWLVCVLEGFFLLGDYFRTPFLGPIFPLDRTGPTEEVSQADSSRELLLYASLALLTGAAALTAFLAVRDVLEAEVFGLMGALFFLMAALVLPGISLETSGLGEFTASLSLVVLPPALAFLTLYGDFQRYLSLVVFPLFPLHLALALTLRLRSYSADMRRNHKTLLVRMGWVRGVFLHNLLVLSGFLLFGAALLFGFPLRIAGPVFIALLPAGYLIWYYANLEGGAPVRWALIISLSLVIFYLPVYLLLFAVWVN